MNYGVLTRTGGRAFLFLFGPTVVSRRRHRFSARQRVGHVVRHGRPEAAGCGGGGGGLHGHGLRHERLVVGRRPLGQPPRPLSAPSAAPAPLRLLGVPDVDVAVKVAEVGRRERRPVAAAAALLLRVVEMVWAGLMHWRRRRGGHLREFKKCQESENRAEVQWIERINYHYVHAIEQSEKLKYKFKEIETRV